MTVMTYNYLCGSISGITCISSLHSIKYRDGIDRIFMVNPQPEKVGLERSRIGTGNHGELAA
jgi:hypothetical protein